MIFTLKTTDLLFALLALVLLALAPAASAPPAVAPPAPPPIYATSAESADEPTIDHAAQW